MKKETIKISKEEMNKKLVNSPNPLHMEACLRGSQVYKNKKKYTRKEKYKKDWE